MDSDKAETLLFHYRELHDAAHKSDTNTDTAGREGQRQGGYLVLLLQRAAPCARSVPPPTQTGVLSHLLNDAHE